MPAPSHAEPSTVLATAQRFVRALTRELPLSEGAKLVDPACRVHFNGRSYAFGPESWRNYLHFLWACGRLEHARAQLGGLQEQPGGIVLASGRWRGTSKGQAVTYPVSVRWRIRDGKVVEIHTKLSNYVPFFPAMAWPGGVAVVALRYKLWRRIERPGPPVWETPS